MLHPLLTALHHRKNKWRQPVLNRLHTHTHTHTHTFHFLSHMISYYSACYPATQKPSINVLPRRQTKFHTHKRWGKEFYLFIYLFFYWRFNPLWVCILQPSSGAIVSSRTRFLDHTHEEPQSVGLLWTSDQSVAETSTWQHTKLTTDKHPCLRWDSNPWTQEANGPRPTP